MSVDWNVVKNKMLSYNGFVEGPSNQNPWGAAQGSPNAAWCCSFACMNPYDLGYRWWPESQFGAKGNAYCPYHQNHAEAHGEWQYDHTSRGQPADLKPGDQVLFDWNGNAVADHIETVIATYMDLTYDTVGGNTGSPEGVHAPIRRDRKYLLGRVRPSGYTAATPAPTPVPGAKPSVIVRAFTPEAVLVAQYPKLFGDRQVIIVAPTAPIFATSQDICIGCTGLNARANYIGKTRYESLFLALKGEHIVQ